MLNNSPAKIAYLSLGSNLGDRADFIQRALQMLILQAGLVTQTSKIYETEPWGYTEQPAFYNQVVEVLTPHTPEKLLKICLNIERQLGRFRGNLWGERSIDIDILLYNSEVVNSAVLTVPHPYLAQRRFVLVPLCEIAAYVIHPAMGFTMQQLLEKCPDQLATKVVEI